MGIKHLDSIGPRDGVARAGCYRDGHNTDIVDMDVLIEGEGRLVICRRCVEAAAEAIGMVTTAEAKGLKTRVKNLLADKEGLQTALRDKERLIDELVFFKEKYVAEEIPKA